MSTFRYRMLETIYSAADLIEQLGCWTPDNERTARLFIRAEACAVSLGFYDLADAIHEMGL